MRRPFLLAVLGVCGLLSVVGAASCQTYDFEPVLPVTLAQTTFRTLAYQKSLKANLFVLIDRSGSMSTKIIPGCTSGCATRISEVQSAMDGFLRDNGTLARMGLAFFPGTSSSCAATSQVEVGLPAPTADDTGTDATLQSTANAMRAAISAASPNGGTPTAPSAAFVGALTGLNANDGRDDYLLLMTDGLPNCNGANPNNVCGCNGMSCAAEAQCRCTLGTLTNGSSACLPVGSCNIGCLDQDASVTAIAALYDQRRIKTIVIGFGTDTAGGDARTVLTAMAAAGGFSNTFFQVGNAAELGVVLQSIAAAINGNACQFQLTSQPSDPSLLAVLVDGQGVPPGADSWSYTPTATGGLVTFADTSPVCARIKASGRDNPVVVEIRIVQRL